MNKLLIFVLLISFSVAAYSESDVTSGKGLLHDCSKAVKWMDSREDVPDRDVTECLNYIYGYSDALTAYAALGKPLICVPDGVSIEQLIKIVVKFLNGFPEALHELRMSLTWYALFEKFPCKQGLNDE